MGSLAYKDTVKFLVYNNHKIIYLKRKFVLLSWSDSTTQGNFPIILQRYNIMLTCTPFIRTFIYRVSLFSHWYFFICGEKSLVLFWKCWNRFCTKLLFVLFKLFRCSIADFLVKYSAHARWLFNLDSVDQNRIYKKFSQHETHIT